RTVAGVASVASRDVMLFIAEQMGQFAIEGAFNESLAKVFQEVFNLSGCLAAGEQLIDKLRVKFVCLLFGLNGHGSGSFLKYGCLLQFVRLHKFSDTLIVCLRLAGAFAKFQTIGIGRDLTAPPSHTTVHTVPYTAVRTVMLFSYQIISEVRLRRSRHPIEQCSAPGSC